IEGISSNILLARGRNLAEERIIPTNSGLKMGGKEFMIYGIRIIPKKDAAIFIDRKCFRGVVDVIRTEKMKLLVINHLDVEKYLYGVLQHEVPYYWPMEAIKAQAVVARTFALYRMEIMQTKDFDVTCDVYSQVYGGKSGEKRRVKKAVDMTRGMILTYDGMILPAYYHSICAGHTEDAGIVFGIDLPPLKGKPCPYCKGARRTAWKAMFSLKDIEKHLNDYGIKVKGISDIEEGRKDRSGRLETVKIKDKEGQKEIMGFKLRLALGPNSIKSTNFSIIVTPGGVVFNGKGWGHGVGMCQWGAFGMAKRHFNYKEILAYYYPETRIIKIQDR
ncbi:MAG: SpoIID/LytB domain-containing protein, partial [Candidatus Omnitrophica bacterium]|nr:SpoIID/LytB domain-containing protein [Candidatus Omnitrophota bacterium]